MFKNKTMIATFILAICLLFGGTSAARAQQPAEGSFDEFEENTIVGWAWDPATPNTAIPVYVTVTNDETDKIVSKFESTAGIFRQDLKDNSIGNGKHGFRIRMDWESLPAGSYTVRGWIEDLEFLNTKTYVKEAPVVEEEIPEEEVKEESSNLRSLGTFRTTAYCPCRQCSEGWGRQTSSGATARSGHTVAVDPRVIPMGTKLMIDGVVYTAEDRGGGVKGKHIDIFFDTHAQTRQHGSVMKEVFLILE